MSGFLPDLANWALRGVNEPENGEEAGGLNSATEDQQNLTPAEIRARRLARMGAAPMEGVEKTETAVEQMDVEDEKVAPPSKPVEVRSEPRTSGPLTQELAQESPQEPQQKKSKASKIDKKKELMVKKVLSVSLAGSNSDPNTVRVDSEEITVQSISEILACRLSMQGLPEIHRRKGLVSYLGVAHKKATDELKIVQQQTKKSPELEEILGEIRKQSVSYAASGLMVPDLFEVAKDGSKQLAKALLASVTDFGVSITTGSGKKQNSFYSCLCEELISQDEDSFKSIIGETAKYLVNELTKVETLLDTDCDGGSGSIVVAALASMCKHKPTACVIAKLPNFLLPEKGSAEARIKITPPPPQMPANANMQQQQLMQFMQVMLRGGNRGYLKRSGPALEKNTVLGLVMRLGFPRDNATVQSSLPGPKGTVDAVENSVTSHRRQLVSYQQYAFSFVEALVKAGAEPRELVMKWLTDALLVNVHATAMRPDKTKVCQPSTLLAIQVILLKLCGPFMDDEKKISLLKPGFVSSPADHGGVFDAQGDDAIQRLGEASSGGVEYNPKNRFVPQLFFFAARSIHLGVVPYSSSYFNIVQNLSHMDHNLRQQNNDPSQDPQFRHLIGIEQTDEINLFEDEMVSLTLRFCNLMAAFILQLKEEEVKVMPEHFIDDICEMVKFFPKIRKARMLAGHEYRNIFRLVVKLLSPKYAGLVRNYNLRAKLGDVLHDVYLPPEQTGRYSVPASVYSDPLSGGQSYLIADANAQQTLAPSLLLLYGEVEHTGYYQKMRHRAKISSLLKYLWDSEQHRGAFKGITDNKDSFIKFANGLMNETNSLIASVMEKLPEIRRIQQTQQSSTQWAALTDEQRETMEGRLEEYEEEVSSALPLCNKTLQMLGFLNTDDAIRKLFLLEEMCPRLVNMLLHVLTKLVGSKGLELKVDNPEKYNFRPKEMLGDVCTIFALFANETEFQVQCVKSGYYRPDLVVKAVKHCGQHQLLSGTALQDFRKLPGLLLSASQTVSDDDALMADAPDDFLDPLLMTFMKDPVYLPTSDTVVDRATITQHLLNDPTDPFNRKELTMDMVQPATELKERMTKWLQEKRAAASQS